jgi:organic hydroperoxide reductase OsmC/OhrA
MLTQLAKFSPLYNVPIEEAEVDVRANFSVADKYDLGGPPGAFQQVTFDLKVSSSAPDSQVAKLIIHAERACHAAQTFRAPVPVELKATLNGEALALH